jgi:hypothetical protein
MCRKGGWLIKVQQRVAGQSYNHPNSPYLPLPYWEGQLGLGWGGGGGGRCPRPGPLPMEAPSPLDAGSFPLSKIVEPQGWLVFSHFSTYAGRLKYSPCECTFWTVKPLWIVSPYAWVPAEESSVRFLGARRRYSCG